MCFTLAGRIQTRLLSLIGPLILLAAASVAAADAGPLRMLALLLVLGLALDACFYRLLIGFQPRWLTIVLGAFEFALLFGLMHQLAWRPYVIMPHSYYVNYSTGLHADLAAALALYLPAWLLGWLTSHALLPWLRPRWAEDGGELRERSPRPGRHTVGADPSAR